MSTDTPADADDLDELDSAEGVDVSKLASAEYDLDPPKVPAEEPLPETVDVRLRLMVDSDRPFIVTTWLRNYRSSSPWARSVDQSVFYRNHSALVHRLLDTESTAVLCAANMVSQIFAFACGRIYDSAILMHYAYVKKSLRLKGLGRLLLEPFGWRDGNIPLIATHWTSAAEYLSGRWAIGYNPYLLHREFRSQLDGTEATRRPAVK